MKILYKITLFFTLLIYASNILGQQTEREKGIELYQKGDFSGAIEKLRGETDATALHHLGLSFEKINQRKDAADAFENSFKKFYELFEKEWNDRFDRTITTPKQKFSDFLKNLAPKYQLGVASAENAVRLKAKMAKQNEWLGKAIRLVKTIEFAKTEEIFYASDEVDTAIKLLDKPRASYTGNARENNVSGQVLLMVAFGSDGKIKYIVPILLLPSGLTEEAIKAAKKIKFEPAVKNGKPVSVVNIIQYGFSFG